MVTRLFSLLLVLALGTSLSFADMLIEPVIFGGDLLPGPNNGAPESFEFKAANEVIRINDRNEISFIASAGVVDGTQNAGHGIWQFSNGRFQNLLSPQGVPTRYGELAVHDDDTYILLPDQGQTFILDEALGDQPYGVWRWTATESYRPVTFESYPGIASASAYSINTHGSALVHARFRESTNFEEIDSGTWMLGADGALTRLTEEGQPISGRAERFENANVFSLTNEHQALFTNGPNNSRSLWKLTEPVSGAAVPIAVPGETLAYRNLDAVLDSVWDARMNSNGEIVAEATFQVDGARPVQGILRNDEEGNELIALSSNLIPAIEGRYLFGGFGDVRINDRGDVAFTSLLSDGANATANSIWQSKDDTLSLVMTTDDTLPGMAPDETIYYLDSVHLNERGQFAFGAAFGTEFDQKMGIWIVDADGEVVPAAVAGVEYLSPDGETITLSHVDEAWDFNNQGTLVFDATTTERRSGIFRSTVATIPEPSSSLQLVIAGLWLAVCFRRQLY